MAKRLKNWWKSDSSKTTRVLRIGTLSFLLAIVMILLCSCSSNWTYHEEVQKHQYELITTKDKYQSSGNINGNIFNISGRIGTDEVYRIYYWVDKTTKEAAPKTLYDNQTRLFFDLKEDENPFFVEIQTIEYCTNHTTGSITPTRTVSVAYELHLPENAIIQEFELDAEN